MKKWTKCNYDGCRALAKENYCPLHQERRVCKYYRIKERSVDVPWCNEKENEILGIDGSWYCSRCKDREEIIINLPITWWAKNLKESGQNGKLFRS